MLYHVFVHLQSASMDRPGMTNGANGSYATRHSMPPGVGAQYQHGPPGGYPQGGAQYQQPQTGGPYHPGGHGGPQQYPPGGYQQPGTHQRPVSHASTLPAGTAPPGARDLPRGSSLDRKDGKPPMAPRSDKDKKHHRGVLGSIFKKSKKDKERKSDV